MEWGLRQTLEVLVLGGVGVLAHLAVVVGRRHYVANLTELAGPRLKSMVAAHDVVVALLLLAFVAAGVSFGSPESSEMFLGPGQTGPRWVEFEVNPMDTLLNKVAILAVLLAGVEVLALRILHAVALNLTWPRRWFVPRPTTYYPPPPPPA